jgi:hypothetical protein
MLKKLYFNDPLPKWTAQVALLMTVRAFPLTPAFGKKCAAGCEVISLLLKCSAAGIRFGLIYKFG